MKKLVIPIIFILLLLVLVACDGAVPTQPEQPAVEEPAEVPEQPAVEEPAEVPEQPAVEEPVEVPEQPIAPTPADAVVQPIAPTPADAVVQPIAPTPADAVVQPIAPTPTGAVVQPIAPTPTVEVVQPIAPTPTAEVVQPIAPTPTQVPVVPSAGEPGSGSELITLDTQLPYFWEVVPPTPYDESQPPGPQGLPLHVKVWIGVDDPAQVQGSTPLMYIIPVEAYDQQWQQNGNDSVGLMIDDIFQFTVALPEPPPSWGVPVLPFEEISGVPDFATQLDRASHTPSSASKNGYRFVGRFAQDMNPVTSDGLPLQYMYQGFTNDGRLLVTYFQEVTSDALPTNAEVADEFNQASSQAGGYDDFLQAQSYLLNELESSDWQPDLALSDDLIGSLSIRNMPETGIQDQVWMLTTLTTADGTEQEVGGTTDYTVIFSADGTYTFQADCNSGGGQYAVTGGMVGELTAEPGPTTLAECGPDSDYDILVGGLLAAEEFRVHPGGAVLELVLPSEGGSLFFTVLVPVR